MKAFKRVFLAAALLTSVPVLTLLAPSGHAQQAQEWVVLADAPAGDTYLFIRVGAPVGTRTEANAAVENWRDCGYTGVHAVPLRAYEAQVAANISYLPNPAPSCN